jgi:hypothetical protein
MVFSKTLATPGYAGQTVPWGELDAQRRLGNPGRVDDAMGIQASARRLVPRFRTREPHSKIDDSQTLVDTTSGQLHEQRLTCRPRSGLLSY